MDFDLSEEQRLLKESIDGLLADSYDFDARKKYQGEKDGWSRSVWSKLAEQGLLGLPFSEEDGGFGGGAVETMIVMEAIGRALVARPKLMLLDEPSLGLAPNLVEQVFETLSEINRSGVSILLVEQNALLALEVSHRGYVFELGKIVASASSADLMADDKLSAAYLGG